MKLNQKISWVWTYHKRYMDFLFWIFLIMSMIIGYMLASLMTGHNAGIDVILMIFLVFPISIFISGITMTLVVAHGIK